MPNHTENGSFREFGDKLMTETKKASNCLFTINSRKNKKSDGKKQQQQ